MNEAAAEDAVRALLIALDIDPKTAPFEGTPRRVAHAYAELFAGVKLDPCAPLRRGDPIPAGVGLVALRGLEFRSTCSHHLLPFSGVVHIAYLPSARIVGIGALVRTLEILSTRPQLQEELAQQLSDALLIGAEAAGALVVIEARHSCIADRGPREATSIMVVVAASGSLRDPAQRESALKAIRVDA